MKKRPDQNMVDVQALIYCEKIPRYHYRQTRQHAENRHCARQDMERLLGSPIFLDLGKGEKDWRDSDFLLKTSGYDKKIFKKFMEELAELCRMVLVLFLHSKTERDDGYGQKQTALWQRFTQTGQVSDYLRYHESTDEQENGRRRIENSSKYKNFIDIAEEAWLSPFKHEKRRYIFFKNAEGLGKAFPNWNPQSNSLRRGKQHVSRHFMPMERTVYIGIESRQNPDFDDKSFFDTEEGKPMAFSVGFMKRSQSHERGENQRHHRGSAGKPSGAKAATNHRSYKGGEGASVCQRAKMPKVICWQGQRFAHHDFTIYEGRGFWSRRRLTDLIESFTVCETMAVLSGGVSGELVEKTCPEGMEQDEIMQPFSLPCRAWRRDIGAKPLAGRIFEIKYLQLSGLLASADCMVCETPASSIFRFGKDYLPGTSQKTGASLLSQQWRAALSMCWKTREKQISDSVFSRKPWEQLINHAAAHIYRSPPLYRSTKQKW